MSTFDNRMSQLDQDEKDDYYVSSQGQLDYAEHCEELARTFEEKGNEVGAEIYRRMANLALDRAVLLEREGR